MKILAAILLTFSLCTISDAYSSNKDILIQQLRIEHELTEQRELRRQTEDLEYAEQQRYLRQAKQDEKIRRLEDKQLELEEKKRRWPERFDVKHGFY